MFVPYPRLDAKIAGMTRSSRRPALAAAAALTVAALAAACGSSAATPPPVAASTTAPKAAAPTAAPAGSTPGAGGDWTSYHVDQSRTAATAASAPLDPARPLWRAELGGKVYGQALAFAGRVFAATETDRVVALDPATGAVVWSTSLGTPLRDASPVIGCGDISPLGVTSTPVIDPATGTIYAVGEVTGPGDRVSRRLVGLDVTTGAIEVSDTVDPPVPAGESQAPLLQRAGLALANGRVYIAYGGNYGDCGHYHGWVVAVNEIGAPDLRSFEVAANGRGGAVWQSGGAPAVDGSGNVYVATGNATPDPPEGGPDPELYTESVIKLSPTLQPLAAFKDMAAGGDEDLSTANPVLLPGGQLFAAGKTDIGYVLRQSDMTQVAAIPGICGSDPDGGPAYDRSTNRLFVPCRAGGIQVVDLTRRVVAGRLPGANGAPIVTGADVWALRYPSGSLHEYAASAGTQVQSVDVGPVAPFVSPTSAYGLLLVPTVDGVTALAGPSGVHLPAGG